MHIIFFHHFLDLVVGLWWVYSVGGGCFLWCIAVLEEGGFFGAYHFLPPFYGFGCGFVVGLQCWKRAVSLVHSSVGGGQFLWCIAFLFHHFLDLVVGLWWVCSVGGGSFL